MTTMLHSGRRFASSARRAELADHCPQLHDVHITELEQRGWTVVENVMPRDECDALVRTWLDTIESYGGAFRANDPSTWRPSTLPIGTRGMQDYPPVAHEPFAWRARLALAGLYAKLWGVANVDDMVTSFDRVCFVPSTMGKVAPSRAHGWMHIDQTHPTRRGPLECVQGFLTLRPIDQGEVALEVYEGAHVHHGAFFKWLAQHEPDALAALRQGNFHKLSEKAREWYLQQPTVTHVRVHAPAGAVVLWDSRLPHHAMAPIDSSKRSTIDRHVIYVSMIPRAWVTPAKLAARIRAYERHRATSHWPQDARLFGETPRYGCGDRMWTYSHAAQRSRLLNAMSPDEMDRIAQLVGYPTGGGHKRKRDEENE